MKNGTTDKMWSPGGEDFSISITDFVTFIISHAIFFLNFGILKSLWECLGPKEVFLQLVLERCHAEHTTFEMCRCKVITLVASHLGYITFCLSISD